MCLFGLNAFAFLPEHTFRLRQQGISFLIHSGIAAALAVLLAIITLIVLIRDDRNAYPSMRLAVATFLWALACFPTGWLTIIVVGEVLRL